MTNELEAVLAELEAVRTALQRDLAFVEIEESFGRIFAAAGADILPGRTAAPGPAMTPEALAAGIAAAERAWMRGEAAVRPKPEEASR